MPHALQQITEQREQGRENERERYWSATRQIFTSSLVCAALWDLPFIMLAAWIRSQCKHYRTEIWQALPGWRRSANLFISCGFRSTIRQRRLSPFLLTHNQGKQNCGIYSTINRWPGQVCSTQKQRANNTIFSHVGANFASSAVLLCLEPHLRQTTQIL